MLLVASPRRSSPPDREARLSSPPDREARLEVTIFLIFVAQDVSFDGVEASRPIRECLETKCFSILKWC